MLKYQLLPMNRSHLAELAAIERESFSTPWTEKMLEEELYQDTASYIVALGEDGAAVGYAGLHVVLDEGYIDNIAVRADCRRQGIADALLDTFQRFGAAHLAFLTLEVRLSNRPAIDLYLKHGFSQVARRKDYYTNPTEDAILMTLDFPKEDVQ